MQLSQQAGCLPARIRAIKRLAKARTAMGRSLTQHVETRMTFYDRGAVQWQLTTAILEETRGLKEDDALAYLLMLGMMQVLKHLNAFTDDSVGEEELLPFDTAIDGPVCNGLYEGLPDIEGESQETIPVYVIN